MKTFFTKTLLILLRTKINNATRYVAIVLPQPHLLPFLNEILAFMVALFHQENIKIIILCFPKNHVEFFIDVPLNVC